MPFVTPPADYEVKPGDLVEIRFQTGVFGPPIWVIEDALALSEWDFRAGRYEGPDLILQLERKHREGPEIIQAGAVPGYIIGLLAAAGLGLVTLLLVKDFRVWVDEGGVGFETSTSIPGFILVAALGLGLVYLGARK